jgi:hypothetical protein
LFFAVVGCAGGIMLGRLVRFAVLGKRAAPGGAGASQSGGQGAGMFASLPCNLGDVVVRRVEGDEAWLAGALVFLEDRPVGALFVAPEARRDVVVLAREGRTELAWLAPASSGEAVAGRDPPSAIEHEGVRFDRTRRTPVRVERIGTGAPSVGATAIVAEYTGPGAERYVVLAGTDATLAWHGVALAEQDYDVLPGGGATLE